MSAERAPFLRAVSDAVTAAGGKRAVAARLWPDMEPSAGVTKLRGGLHPTHPQKIDLQELEQIAKLAGEHGDISIAQYLAQLTGHRVIGAPVPNGGRRRRRLLSVVKALQRLIAQLAQLVEEV